MAVIVGVIVVVAVGAAAIWYLLRSDGSPSSADAAAAIDRIIDDLEFDDDDFAELGDCPFGSPTRAIDDAIARIDDPLLDIISRGEPGIAHDTYALHYPDSDVRTLICERYGPDPALNAVGISASRTPEDVVGYLTELTGIEDLADEIDADPDEITGEIVRWICTDSEDADDMFCEALWYDRDLLLSLYVFGTDADAIDSEHLGDVVRDAAGDWIESIVDAAPTG